MRVVEARRVLGRLAQDLIFAKEFIEESSAELETYGSKATRDALRAFDALIERTPIEGSHRAGMLHSVRDLKRRSVAQQDYDEAPVARRQEKDMLTAIADGLPEDPPVYRDSAQALIDAARKDLRSPDA